MSTEHIKKTLIDNVSNNGYIYARTVVFLALCYFNNFSVISFINIKGFTKGSWLVFSYLCECLC